ncbi:MspA family porin [Mycobacterium sp. M26]|uniref:MspA family porin n=1 Tax=Mycobacterium sp. M26 TaxID=1762962 RepID=UPI00073F550E|nr:MspA family porin [Mycobacterium sp. M26]
MLHRFTALLSACLVTAIATAPHGLADPPADPNVAPVAAGSTPPAPGGPGAAPIASGAPGTLTTPDGWVLSIGAKNESLEPVASLTNSPWSREYLVDGVFEGAVTGSGKTKLAGGTLEAGYQIGCGIIQDDIESITTGGITPGVGIPFVSGNLLPITLGLSASEQIKIDLKPGTVNIVPVGKKSFKGTKSRVSITGFRIKVDGCAGQSFIRSYATFTSSTDNTDDVVTYLGVTRAV